MVDEGRALTQAQDGLLAGHKLHAGAPIPVLRLARLLGDLESSAQQIVIVRSLGRLPGLVVDRLGPVPEIAATDLQPLRPCPAGPSPETRIGR